MKQTPPPSSSDLFLCCSRCVCCFCCLCCVYVDDSEYADDTALCYASRRDAEQQTGPLMAHFGDWGMEVHAGKPGKNSKSEILFCPAPPHVYADAAKYDGADLSDVQLPGGLTMPVVFFFKYLGDRSGPAACQTAAGQRPRLAPP